MSDDAKLTKNESIKVDSVYLAGSVAQEVADSSTPNVSKESYELLKFHGSYQQFDRDQAEAAKKAASKKGERAAKDDKEWIFMVRMKIPAGRLKASQYAKLDQLADDYANGTLRITTRETFQFHYIVKGNLKQAIATMNDELVSTMGGCGDVVRNVMACPAPIKDAKYDRMLADALEVSRFTLPKTSAYHEIWLDGKNVARNMDNDDLEPLYGRTYLPRKFKIGIALPEDNSIDVLTHDLAIIPIYDEGDDETLQGYNICLGGGMGMTHNKPATYPRLASPICFIGADELLKGVEASVKLHRDHGDRTNRKHARLKYVVEENGIAWTKQQMEGYFGHELEDPRPMGEFKVVDHMGWHEQGDGNWYLGIPISSGRIIDRGDEKIRSGIRAIVDEFQKDMVLTADQNAIICDVTPEEKDLVQAKLQSFGVKLVDDITPVYRNTLACVALPTCGLALAEAERIKLPFIDELEQSLAKHGIPNEPLDVRISGCPNGCSRTYNAEIAIVGRMPGHYAMFVGGDFDGTRMATKILDRVPYEHVVTVLDVLVGKFVKEREANEAFGDFCNRLGNEHVIALIDAALGETYKWAKAAA